MRTIHHILLATVFTAALNAQSPDLGGVKVSWERYTGSASFTATSLGKFELRVEVDRKGETQPLTLRIALPSTGRDAWPANIVEVRDSADQAMLVRRSGIEWDKLLIPLPQSVTSCVVQAVDPAGGWPQVTSEKDRVLQDAISGVSVRIANWPQGRTAALSIRFDDSHPTHLSKAIPILREYGFKGTFMVNPGPKEPGSRQNYSFETQHAEWEAVMKQGDMELANHSAHHRGAKGDEDMEREISGAAAAIWKLTPGKSKLTALNLGGGTMWETTRTLRYYLDKYHQFDASSGSLGMDDSYGGRVEAFRKALQTHLERGLWCRVHYHYIGEGLSSSEANFRSALDIAKQHQDKLWIAGMADIYKYQTERSSAKLTLVKSDANSLAFQLDCGTEATLYDQPLTLEFTLPESWRNRQVILQDSKREVVKPADSHLRFEVPPVSSAFVIQAMP
ncbi:MAG: polysaccharide deacetylase family protein [Verrucomicrobiaceae bacterium]|nr:polysaccharide deacetylase family protein [Verrucomicrobiaceae bacterium]